MAVRDVDETSAAPGPLLRLVSDRRIAFLIVGAFNTLVAFVIFIGFNALLGDSFWGYMTTLAVTHVGGVLCAFVLHRRFVFRVRGHVWIDLARFESVNLAALGLNAVLLPLLVEFGGLAVIPAQVVATVAVVVISYFGHSAFSFRRKPAKQS